MNHNVKVHHTHKQRIRSLAREGYSEVELAEMYKAPLHVIRNIIKNTIKPERI